MLLGEAHHEGWDDAAEELEVGISHLAQSQPGLPVPVKGGEPGEQHSEEQQQQVRLQQLAVSRALLAVRA